MLLPASSFNAPLEALPLRVTPAARLRSLYMTAVAAPFRRHASLFSSSGFLLKRFVFPKFLSWSERRGNRAVVI